MRDVNDLSAFTQIETLQELTSDGVVRLELRVLTISIIGVIYALLYIGDCIKEIKYDDTRRTK